MAKKTKKKPSLLDLAKTPKKAKVKSKPPKTERRAPKILSNDRYRVLFRRLSPKDESIPAEVEAGDVVTFYGRDGASRTRIVETLAGQMVRLAELTANLGGESHVVIKAESVHISRLVEVLRPKEES